MLFLYGGTWADALSRKVQGSDSPRDPRQKSSGFVSIKCGARYTLVLLRGASAAKHIHCFSNWPRAAGEVVSDLSRVGLLPHSLRWDGHRGAWLRE